MVVHFWESAQFPSVLRHIGHATPSICIMHKLVACLSVYLCAPHIVLHTTLLLELTLSFLSNRINIIREGITTEFVINK